MWKSQISRELRSSLGSQQTLQQLHAEQSMMVNSTLSQVILSTVLFSKPFLVAPKNAGLHARNGKTIISRSKYQRKHRLSMDTKNSTAQCLPAYLLKFGTFP
mmetsp:Transcript_10210/g.20715  ORF Transcript_10210/g.20715 Transcript_10210/m.20715 type:complete len:102 (-) Transcript_10210:369-674(-)